MAVDDQIPCGASDSTPDTRTGRREYRSPRLTEFGRLSDLTRSGGNDNSDGVEGSVTTL